MDTILTRAKRSNANNSTATHETRTPPRNPPGRGTT